MKRLKVAEAAESTLGKFTGSKWNCAESVLYGIVSQIYDNDEERMKYVSLISGFNGGVGATKHLCGTISGSVASFGILFGRFGLLQQDNKLCSCLAKEFVSRFDNLFSSVDCADLTRDFDDFHSDERRIHCRKFVEYAVKECIDIINENL